jgi:predicted RNase H-like HicB family nuclease
MTDTGVFHIIKGGIVYELERDEDGSFAINVPALPGCISVGDTIEEALDMIAEATELWLEVARERGLSIPAQFELQAAS